MTEVNKQNITKSASRPQTAGDDRSPHRLKVQDQVSSHVSWRNNERWRSDEFGFGDATRDITDKAVEVR